MVIPAFVLRAIRNDLPMPVTIGCLAPDGPYGKMSECFFRFVCPHCRQIRATVNPKNNLAHCFCCHRNFNNIDLLLALGYDFIKAVALLWKWLKEYKAGAGGPGGSDHRRDLVRPERGNRTVSIGEILSGISESVGNG
ncbi:MAG: hypothetical protein ABIF71_14775 [Planctomycetota bacterium]